MGYKVEVRARPAKYAEKVAAPRFYGPLRYGSYRAVAVGEACVCGIAPLFQCSIAVSFAQCDPGPRRGFVGQRPNVPEEGGLQEAGSRIPLADQSSNFGHEPRDRLAGANDKYVVGFSGTHDVDEFSPRVIVAGQLNEVGPRKAVAFLQMLLPRRRARRLGERVDSGKFLIHVGGAAQVLCSLTNSNAGVHLFGLGTTLGLNRFSASPGVIPHIVQ